MDSPCSSNASSNVNVDSAHINSVQRRTLRLLFATQVIGGVGVGIGISVGALLAADMGGPGISGLASSAAVIGGALLAVPATRLMRTGGRRPGLVFAYLVGAVGALVVVAGAGTDLLPLVFLGTLLFGGGTAANLQARYTAVDLAEPGLPRPATLPGGVGDHDRRGRRPGARAGGRPGRARLRDPRVRRAVRVQRARVRAGRGAAVRAAAARPAAPRPSAGTRDGAARAAPDRGPVGDRRRCRRSRRIRRGREWRD